MKTTYGFDWKRKKTALFERFEVDTIPQLLDTLQSLREKGYFFRGLSDAKRKLVSSIQRVWHTGGCWKCNSQGMTFAAFMTGLLEHARKSEIFNFCRGLLTDQEIWAYLQHYCCPTPLLDFSENPFVGLFFATNNASETRGFCSLYAIQPSGYIAKEEQDMQDLDTFIRKATALNDERMASAGIKPSTVPLRLRDEGRFKTWGFFKNGGDLPKKDDAYPDCLLEDGVAFFVSKAGNGWCPKITAGRVNLQEGLFVYAPIEELSFEDFIESKRRKVKPGGCRDDLSYPQLKCFDIPPRLVRELKDVVKGEGITNEQLGLSPCPEENAVKKMFGAYLNALEEGAK